MPAKLPSFQLYPGDWMKDPDLRRCSHAARGVMIDCMCLMFECEERGVFVTGGRPWTEDDIVQAVGGNRDVALASLRELLEKGVLRRRESDGAVFSSRMVRDEAQRAATRERVKRHRNGGCNGDVTPMKRGISSSSSPSGTPPNPPRSEGGGESGMETGIIGAGGRRPQRQRLRDAQEAAREAALRKAELAAAAKGV